jgi:hypothetical protein
VWAEAAKALNKYDEAVLTVLDADGYPASARVDPHSYDGTSGELQASLPDTLNAAAGPANLMCHYHDEKMWNIRSVAVKGRLERRSETWVFVSTSFTPPSKLAVVSFIKGARTSGQKYLDRRGLERPQLDWAAIKELGARARGR